MQRIVLIAIILMIVSAAPYMAYGQPAEVSSLLEEAQNLLAEEDFGEAWIKLEEAQLDIWNRAPMTLADVAFTVGPAESYGIYEKRPNNQFSVDETIYVYLEPRGYTIKPEGEFYKLGIAIDVLLLDKEGKILTGQENFGRFNYSSYRPLMSLFLSLNLTGIPVGEYELRFIVRDLYSDKKVSTSLTAEFF